MGPPAVFTVDTYLDTEFTGTIGTGYGGGINSSLAAVFDAILNRVPTAPVELNTKVPAELERIVNKTLEKDPDRRYAGAAAFGAASFDAVPPDALRLPLST